MGSWRRCRGGLGLGMWRGLLGVGLEVLRREEGRWNLGMH